MTLDFLQTLALAGAVVAYAGHRAVPAAKPARTGNKMASKRNKKDDAPRRAVLRKRSALGKQSGKTANASTRNAAASFR